MSAFIDTDIIVRHLTGDPPAMAERATRFLASERDLLLTDLIVAETVYVLESFYEAPRNQVAGATRSLIAFESIVCVDPAMLLRAIEIYETDRLDFAEARDFLRRTDMAVHTSVERAMTTPAEGRTQRSVHVVGGHQEAPLAEL